MNTKPRCCTRDQSTLVVASASAETRERWSSRLTGRFVIREVAERQALADAMLRLQPHTLLLDMALPGLGGVECLPDIRIASPATRIIVLSDRQSGSEGLSALVAGAKGYDIPAIDPALLEEAVQTVSRGDLWINRAFVRALVAAVVASTERSNRAPSRDPAHRRLERLTPRQREVAGAIARGESNKEIARRLNVTERTVKAHLTEIFRKVGVMDRMQLALLLNDVPGARVGRSTTVTSGLSRSAREPALRLHAPLTPLERQPSLQPGRQAGVPSRRTVRASS
jgi:two-component system, NarL family, nitrate/nitrite response regulator NarL